MHKSKARHAWLDSAASLGVLKAVCGDDSDESRLICVVRFRLELDVSESSVGTTPEYSKGKIEKISCRCLQDLAERITNKRPIKARTVRGSVLLADQVQPHVEQIPLEERAVKVEKLHRGQHISAERWKSLKSKSTDALTSYSLSSVLSARSWGRPARSSESRQAESWRVVVESVDRRWELDARDVAELSCK